MSGGAFDYKQYSIDDICESVEDIVKNNRKERDTEDINDIDDCPWMFNMDGTLKEEYRYEYDFSDDVIDEMKKGLLVLNLASIYAQRIDWLVSGDDGEESFLERLKEDIDEYVSALEGNGECRTADYRKIIDILKTKCNNDKK